MMKKNETQKSEPQGPEAAPLTGTGATPTSDSGTPPPLAPPGAELGAKEIEELKVQAAKAKEHWDKLLRTAADFENFKKRVARERQEAAKYVHESLLQKLLPVLDHFDRALAAVNDAANTNTQSFQDGILMICQQLKAALAEAGLEEINALNTPFDPHWHEAVSQVETLEVPEGQVVRQLRKGYKLRDRLLRPTSVVVAKPPAEKTETKPA
jgi:molecular chaperone GrpE